MGRRIEATRDGRCSHCGKPVTAGEEIWVKSAGVYYGYACGCGLVAENTTEHEAGAYELAALKDLSKLPAEAADGIFAQNMIGLARNLDAGDVPPRERPNYTKEIRLNLMSLTDQYPATEVDDETDEARKRRERRAREAGGF